jgi:HAD superfamily hydrolase (TIGR01509 family)
VFDLDGVLIDSEPVWEDVRRELVAETGGHWRPEARARLMGMSTAEWARYMHDELGVPLDPEAVAVAVIGRLGRRYDAHLPMLAGAQDAVRRLAARWPLGLASSSPRSLIDEVLERSGLRASFSATVSTEEVARGKPAPDGYLEVAARLRVAPVACVAIEDSSNGVRAAVAAGMRAIAIPRPGYPLDEDAQAMAGAVLGGAAELTAGLVEHLP